MLIQEYLNHRVEDQLSYYSAKSRQNKNNYLLLKISQLIAAALLPFFSIFLAQPDSNIKYVVAFLGTLVTILEGVLAVGKYHEKWVTYRGTAETLKQEKFLFLMQAGSYAGPGAIERFVNRVEFVLGKENSGWQQMIVKENKEKENDTAQPDANNPAAGAQDPAAELSSPLSDNEAAANTTDADQLPIDPLTGVPATEEHVDEDLPGK